MKGPGFISPRLPSASREIEPFWPEDSLGMICLMLLLTVQKLRNWSCCFLHLDLLGCPPSVFFKKWVGLLHSKALDWPLEALVEVLTTAGPIA